MDDQKEQDRIRRRAYEIWEREGSPEGRAEEFWQQAIASLQAEESQNGAAGRAANGNADATPDERERNAEERNSATGK
ncbi:hypothetical protein NOV72_01651 [Caballeronia novacaledonica]|uniref:DUF2934 domain-containing protein n=1 Tax=Caballeronia novacaledonica TaxID=1544861 RepID=A0A2U3I2W9_9BURK|nr:DUF2934 domain-containing protein [Caballeronia novacaledonica]SPB14409.1 hypothetical protein NOV72_01651 [Caballeronia novacaledonica]